MAVWSVMKSSQDALMDFNHASALRFAESASNPSASKSSSMPSYLSLAEFFFASAKSRIASKSEALE
jgi:hypothetical protein